MIQKFKNWESFEKDIAELKKQNESFEFFFRIQGSRHWIAINWISLESHDIKLELDVSRDVELMTYQIVELNDRFIKAGWDLPTTSRGSFIRKLTQAEASPEYVSILVREVLQTVAQIAISELMIAVNPTPPESEK